jgi:hypothetical protein
VLLLSRGIIWAARGLVIASVRLVKRPFNRILYLYNIICNI